MSKKTPKGPTRFQALTCIRQIGTRREPNGTIHYSFAEEIHPDLPVIRVTLTITPTLAISTEAVFDEHARTEPGEARLEEDHPIQAALLNAR